MFQVDLAKLNRGDLESYLRPILSQSTDALVLRSLLEEAANANPLFSSLVDIWGPDVYGKSRVVFRPLILSRFSFAYWDGRFRIVPWTKRMEKWLAEAEASGDTALARLLIEWQLIDAGNKKFWVEPKQWRAELIRRFDRVSGRAARLTELEKMSFGWGGLDEATATHLYAADPAGTHKFILERSPAWSPFGKPEFWEKLIERARACGDAEFALSLYRKQVTGKRWTNDALALCAKKIDVETLLSELERIHPLQTHDLGDGMVAILEARGRDAVPYVLRHLRNVFTGWFGRGEFGRILKIAAAKQWWDLWSSAVRTCATPKEYNDELAKLLGNRTLAEEEVRQRLAAISGVSREWNFPAFGLATVNSLDDANALALYDRFPDLLRGSFKIHLHQRSGATHRAKLIDRLIASGEPDEDLLDFIASRYTTIVTGWQYGTIAPETEQLARYYTALRDQDRFARRAAAVLGQIPAFSIHQYPKLIRENRLARLLFERSQSSYLSDGRAVADLVEASEIHVMAMAYRILALDDERARGLAVLHLPLLLGTLLRPLQRATRMAAFGALLNAAGTSENAARTVLNKAREALALPDKKYPKEELVGLIGRIIHRWPALRGVRETPLIYRRNRAA